MKIVETAFKRLPRERLEIGFEGENLRATVRIDCASVFAEYPNATPSLIVKPLFADAYPVVVDRNGTDVDWLITSEILSFNGDGEIQLIFYKDQVICKSAVSKIRVSRSLQVTGEMPDPVVQWIENANRKLAEVDAQIVELEGMVDTATDAATRAQQSESNATTAAANAATSAATASTKAAEAQASANTATAKASEAALSATQARNSAVSAADSERIATAKAVEATTAAGTATTKAEQATDAAQTATEKAGDASASATAAQASATDAASSATAASASETAAKASETAASTSASQAAQSVLDAGANAQTATQKAGEAATSASNAATSATNAATSAETASTKAGEAAQSAQAVEETAEQLADSLEQIDQNTQDIADHEQYAEATYAKKTDLSNLTSDLDLVQESGNIVETDDAFPTFAEDVTVEIVPVQSGSGDPSPENVRPITGFDGVKVSRARKNLLSDQTIYNSGSTYFVGGQSGNVYPFYLKAGTYTFSYDGLGSYSYWQLKGTSTNNVISNGANKYGTFTLPVDGYYRFWFYQPSASSVDDFYNIQLELGSTATDYEPYQGTQVELPFGQTVYGGQIDLTTGKLTVDRASATFNGSEIWYWHASGVAYSAVEGGVITNATTQFNALTLCDKLKQSSWAGRGNLDKSCGMFFGASYIFIKNSESITDAATAKTWLADNPITVVYPLATPQVYDLTPAQVFLLRDYNVLWANTGDIINLEYRAGTFVTKKTYDALKEATLIRNTASGSIASFVDGAEMPVDEVTAQINPVQDLHGYDHPWPGGGGVNKLNPAEMYCTSSTYGLTATIDGEEFVFSGTYTGTIDVPQFRFARYTDDREIPYKVKGFAMDSATSAHYIGFIGKADGNATLTIQFRNCVQGETYNFRVRIVAYEGDTAPTEWTPFSNICPISGFDSVKVSRAGKNLLDSSWLVNPSTDIKQVQVQLKANATYTLSTNASAPSPNVADLFLLLPGETASSVTNGVWASHPKTITTGSEGLAIIGYRNYPGTQIPIDECENQLELGDTATPYEPYQGETYDIAFPSEAGTVYGGSLTIAEDGSGVLTVDMAYDQMTLEWINSRDSSAIGFQSAVTQVGGNSVWIRNWNYANAAPRISGGIKAICNAFPISMHNTTIFASQYRIYFGVGSIETIEEFKAAVQSLEDSGSGLWIAYELATPITYNLTASEIRTLLGQNNIWADTGDVSVKYKADTKLYIDGKIAELVAQIVNS